MHLVPSALGALDLHLLRHNIRNLQNLSYGTWVFHHNPSFATTPVLPLGKICFFTEAGAGFSLLLTPGRGWFQSFFSTRAGAGMSLTKITYNGAGAGFVEEYRAFTGAGVGAGAPVGS